MVGILQLKRTYFVCSSCGDSGCPLDERIGLNDYVSPEALRLMLYAGGRNSFDIASLDLFTYCGLTVSDELIRERTLREGPKIAAFAASSAEATTAFRQASGEVEFETDATKVNTLEGWRDAKIGIFAKRPRGEAASFEDWRDRVLPKPTARFAFAAMQDSQTFASQWIPLARHLGIDPNARLSVLGDGADWIWNRTQESFPNAECVLDIYHGIEHLSDAAKAFLGPESTEVKAVTARGTELLLGDGYAGVTAWMGELGLHPKGGDGTALGGTLNYFAEHQERLPYALRLRRGQSMGSGMVEGAAKNMIGKRIKANNARWVPENVDRIGAVVSAIYSNTWAAYWDSKKGAN